MLQLVTEFRPSAIYGEKGVVGVAFLFDEDVGIDLLHQLLARAFHDRHSEPKERIGL